MPEEEPVWFERHSLLADWAGQRELDGAGRRALVVGCGPGRDAEFISELGYDTVAFDVSEVAVRTAGPRFSNSAVRYQVADPLGPPAQWRGAFHLVVGSMIGQALPVAVGPFVALGGTLLAIGETREEVDAFATAGLLPVEVREVDGRWRAEFIRVAGPR